MSMKSEYNLPSRSPFQKIYDLMIFFISYRRVAFSHFTPSRAFSQGSQRRQGDSIIPIQILSSLSAPALPHVTLVAGTKLNPAFCTRKPKFCQHLPLIHACHGAGLRQSYVEREVLNGVRIKTNASENLCC